ncbi:hypothetical protein [uncultured Pediococcus sp.]|uniref:hypothetical protein n=1 Tax=uncultured Pediococcus sp. TaxID=165192 RepID=UPI00259B76A0|nr:hypothetical protein [uncultured Pediococcus sp.]
MSKCSDSITLCKVSDGAIGPQGPQGEKGADGTNGTNGKDGKGIKSSVVTFQAGSSQKDKPTGTWTNTIPETTEALPYLWTRTVITYTDNTTSEIYTVGVGLNGTHVGGRNLIRGTADQRSGDCAVRLYADSWFKNDIKYGNADTFRTNGAWQGCFYDFYSLYKRENLKVGDVVTFSIKILANFTPKTAVNMHLYRIGSTKEESNNVVLNFGAKTLVPNEWTTYSVTWTITQANLDIKMGNDYGYPRAEVDYYDPDIYASEKKYLFGEGNYIYIGAMKLEKGNIATDWTPAPEDEIKTVSTEYYLSTSATSLSGGSWSATAPTWANGKYMWMRTVVTNGYGDKTYTPSSNGVCIAGAKGDSVASELQYHLDVSASLTTSQLQALANDSWLTESTWEYGRYIYKRVKKTNLGTGAIEYTYQGRDEELENHFKNLLSFKISANRLNYPIDKRALESEKTTIKITIEEMYYNPDSYSVTINGEVQTPTITNDSFTFDIPLKTGKDLYNIVVIPVKDGANITDVYGELNIVALDITEYDKFYGAVSSLTFSGITLLDGDSCFLTQADGDNEANKIYVYQSNAWVDFNSANLSTDKRMLILSKAQKSAMEYANLKKEPIASEYAYIGTLIANYVYAREIGAETIILDGEDGKLVGGDYTTEDSDGFLTNKGIYLDSTGTAKLNDAKLKNCKIDSGEINNITITGAVNNDVLMTTLTDAEGEAISVGSVDETSKWYLKSQAEAKIKSLITANQLYSLSNGENINGNTSLRLLNNTNDSWSSSGSIPSYSYVSQAIYGISTGSYATTGAYGDIAYGNGYLIWGTNRVFQRVKITSDSGAGFIYSSYDNISANIPWYNKNLAITAKTIIIFNKNNNLFYLFCNYTSTDSGYNSCFYATSSNGDSWTVGGTISPFKASATSIFKAKYIEEAKSIYVWGTKANSSIITQISVFDTNGYSSNDTSSVEALNITNEAVIGSSEHLDYIAERYSTNFYYKNGGVITSFKKATNVPSGGVDDFVKLKSKLYAICGSSALYEISDDTYTPVFTKVFDFNSPSTSGDSTLSVFISENYLIIKKKNGNNFYNYIYDGTNYYTPKGTEDWIENAFLRDGNNTYPVFNGKNIYYIYDNQLIRVRNTQRSFQQKLNVLGSDYNDLGAFSSYISGTLINTPIKVSSLNLPSAIPSDMDTYRRIPTLFTQTAVYLSLASASVESYTRFDTSTNQDVVVPAYSGKPSKITTSSQSFAINGTEYANSSWFIKNKTALAITFTPNATAKGVYTGDLNPKEVDGSPATNRNIGNITKYKTIRGETIIGDRVEGAVWG